MRPHCLARGVCARNVPVARDGPRDGPCARARAETAPWLRGRPRSGSRRVRGPDPYEASSDRGLLVPFNNSADEDKENIHTINVTVGSTDLAMMVDTGCDSTAISSTLARRLVASGEATAHGTARVTMADGATATVNVLIIHRLAIGGHVLTDVEASDGGSDMPLLGMSALGRFGKASFDFAAHELVLE
jgi:clan AA aspartic protease (TIGR02281 family)